LQSGEIESAESVCTELLNEHPDDANFLCLSARVLVKLGRFDEADVRLERAQSLYPKFARPYEARGELLMAKGEAHDAADAFRKALELDPKRQRARMKLGQLLLVLGQVEEAEALKSEFMKLDEDNREIAKAAEFEKQEKYAEAEKIYRKILTRHPDNVSAMRLWAALGIREKRYPEAEALLEQAVKVAPGFSRAWSDLCQVQLEQEKHADTIRSAGALIKLKRYSADGHIWLAAATAASGNHADAIEAYDEALEIAPQHVGAMCGKGNACRTIGDHDGAVAAFRSSVKANPLHAEAYWNLANLKTFRFEDQELEDMLALVGDPRISDEGQVQLNNALGLELEGRKEYDRAFEFIDNGNILRRGEEFYDRVENEERANLTIDVFTPQFIDDNAGHGNPDPAPIFIVGLPRSGSTLLEQILASHSMVDGTHELADLGKTVRSNPTLTTPPARYPTSIADIDADGFRQMGDEYIERTRRHRGDSPFFTDKNPNNFVHLGLLHLMLPNAKIINARRHPLDSCFGCYKQLFASGQPFTYDLEELGEYYLQYQRLMDHWHSILPGKVLDVQYEEVVADLEGEVRRILDYCGLEFEESCLRFHETERSVKSASSEQVRTPIYSSSVKTWRHYETHLAALIETLEPLLMQLPEADRPGSLIDRSCQE
jgi:tetratricopeptide (TPR) repeat protein